MIFHPTLDYISTGNRTAATHAGCVRLPEVAAVKFNVCHLIDIGVLLAELSFVLHDGLQVRKMILDLQRSSRVK